MSLVSVQHLTQAFSEKKLFEDLSFDLAQGEKIALIGKNGAGKTTLFRLLVGQEKPQQGQIILPKDEKIGFLSQDPLFDPAILVEDALFSATDPAVQALWKYEKLLEKPQDFETEQELTFLMEKIEEAQAWNRSNEVHQIMYALKIQDLLHQKVETLSGGQKKRVALASLLLQQPAWLFLDEPTNHLDLEMIEWLENYLAQSRLTLFLITHDRYFLDQVCNRILELDQKQIFSYQKNKEEGSLYAFFLEKKAERLANAQSHWEKNQNFLRKEIEWVRRMPKARGTKSKSRLDAYENIKAENAKKTTDKNLILQAKMSRLGNKIIECKNLKKSFANKKIVEDFSYIFQPGEKIGIIGKNGVGKTTFLNLLLGLEPPDSGEISLGETVIFGYYNQKGMNFKEDKRVIDVVQDIADFIPMADGKNLTASQLLQQFLFPPEQQYSLVSRLSGGEKKRLYLLTILIKNPNFLILDEPTNDLDLATLPILEDFLANFKGCLLLVSHDRYLMDRIVDHLFVLEGDGKIDDFIGTYNDYLLETAEKIAEKNQKSEKKLDKIVEKNKITKNIDDHKNFSAKKNNKHQIEKLEKEIQVLEAEKNQLNQKFNHNLTYEEIQKLSEQITIINQKIEEKTLTWMSLGD